MSASGRGHVIVVGAGVIGTCCAYFLAKRGTSVTVIERDRVGRAASFGSAGTIAVGHPPINKPGRVRQALLQMLDPTSPLYIAPHWNPSLARWLWRFRATCTAAHLDQAMRVLGPLGHETRRLFDEIVTRERLECDYRRSGYYEAYLTPRGLGEAAAICALMRREAFTPEILSADELRARIPALKPGVAGGIFFPEAATCDPFRFVTELMARARARGVALRQLEEVSEVLTESGRAVGVRTGRGEIVKASSVVLATGAYSLELVRRLGRPLPVQAGKGYHCDRAAGAPGTPALDVACMLGESSVFCTPMSDRLRLAGTLEFSGVNHSIRPARLRQLTTAAARYLDGVGEAPARSEWCGLRPCAPDGLPVVGPVPGAAGVFVATGHAMMGLTLGPVTGAVVADMVLDGRSGLRVEALRADRF